MCNVLLQKLSCCQLLLLRYLTFHKVVLRHTWAIVRSLVIILLHVFFWFWHWNNFENRLIFDDVKAYKKNCAIFGPPCIVVLPAKVHSQWAACFRTICVIFVFLHLIHFVYTTYQRIIAHKILQNKEYITWEAIYSGLSKNNVKDHYGDAATEHCLGMIAEINVFSFSNEMSRVMGQTGRRQV